MWLDTSLSEVLAGQRSVYFTFSVDGTRTGTCQVIHCVLFHQCVTFIFHSAEKLLKLKRVGCTKEEKKKKNGRRCVYLHITPIYLFPLVFITLDALLVSDAV